MNTFLAAFAAAAALTSTSGVAQPQRPTVLLVHGAFADSSSWNRVITILEKDGYAVIAVANPLRGVKHDADYVARIVKTIDSPVILVGHSYGGSVISEVRAPNVKGLVYVAAFAPDAGETASTLSGMFPGSTLGSALAPPIALPDGGKDLYIRQDLFHEQFAADVSTAEAAVMAAGQRPITEAALNEPARESAWKSIPSWFIYGDADRNIPSQVLAFMAERAHAKRTEVLRGGSHVIMVSKPKAVAKLIEHAALAT